jgi:hypothetical protein
MNDEQNKMGAGRPFKMNNWLTALKLCISWWRYFILNDDLVFLVNNNLPKQKISGSTLKNGKLVNFYLMKKLERIYSMYSICIN